MIPPGEFTATLLFVFGACSAMIAAATYKIRDETLVFWPAAAGSVGLPVSIIMMIVFGVIAS